MRIFFSERGERGQRLDQADGGLGVGVPAGHLGELHDDVGHHVQGLEEAAPGHENQDRLEQDRELLHRKGAQEPITILAGDLFLPQRCQVCEEAKRDFLSLLLP